MISTIKWFNSQKGKHVMKFIMFDVKDFCPFITQDLLKKALNFPDKYINILKCDINVIHHAGKS